MQWNTVYSALFTGTPYNHATNLFLFCFVLFFFQRMEIFILSWIIVNQVCVTHFILYFLDTMYAVFQIREGSRSRSQVKNPRKLAMHLTRQNKWET